MHWTAALFLALLVACTESPSERIIGGSFGGKDEAGGSPDSGGTQPPATGGNVLNTGGLIGATNGIAGTDCRPGRYVGDFEGIYRSQAWGNGDDLFSLMIQGLADPNLGTEALEFRLEKVDSVTCEANDEFCGGFKVTGGKMIGGADPFNSGLWSVQFEIDLTGEVDCRTGEFRGKLSNGFYDVATVLFYFEGDITGDYDRATESFGNGQWSVKEQEKPDAAFPPGSNIGGEGTWQATWVEP